MTEQTPNKSRTIAIILSIFLGLFAWLYTYKYKKDKIKFWVALAIIIIAMIISEKIYMIVWFGFIMIATLDSILDKNKFIDSKKSKIEKKLKNTTEKFVWKGITIAGIITFIIIIFVIINLNNIEKPNNQTNTQININTNNSISKPKIPNPVKLSTREENRNDTDILIKNSFNNAKTYNDTRYCYQISYVNLRGQCIMDVALHNMDESKCDELKDVWKEANNIYEDVYFTEDAFYGLNKEYCKSRIENILIKIDIMDKINAENNNQWDYIVNECKEQDRTFWQIQSRGCDFGELAQKNKDENYCYFIDDEYISKCVKSIEYIKLIDKIEIDGDISDCESIPKNFYFKGSPYTRCIYKFNRS